MKKLFAAILLAIASCTSVPAYAQTTAKPDIIEVIEISGEIGAGTAAAVATQVEKINETAKVKGVLLIVNSPGGGATASAVLYQELSKIKVPVLGHCEYVCASGGVYALMAPSVKFISVSDETIGGSVGVIMHLSRYNRLLEWAKIDNQTFKSGPLKDAGNPTRAGNDADTAYLQGIVDTLAQKFYGVVVKARPKVNLAEIKTAKIFIGEDIVKVGLADAVMSRDEALAKLKVLSGSKNAFTREELGKVVKNASEAANLGLKKFEPRVDGAGDSWLAHASTLMEVLGEIRSGEAATLQYRMPYRF